MKRLLLLTALLCTITTLCTADDLTIENLTNGTYSAKRIHGVNPLADGESYSQLSADGKQILRYSFRTGKQTGVLFDPSMLKQRIRIPRIDGYIMSPDEKHILLQTDTRAIYRHSRTAEYYIYNVKNRTIANLSENGAQEVPKWSPDGNMVAFVRDGNLFLVKLLFNNSETQVTKDGKFGEVINGKPDWVNEEEFSLSRAFDFNADATMLAWVKYNEKAVPTFSFPLYKGLAPERQEYSEYPGAYSYKYPVAGATNSTVTVHSFDIKSRVIRQMQLPLDPDGYVPRITFTNDPLKLLVLTQNRHQNRLDIYVANPRSTECRLIVRDETEKYISENVYKDFQTTPGGFVLMSERSGWNQLYLYDLNGTLKRRLTNGQHVVTDFYGYDSRLGVAYYASNQEGPLYKAVYKTDIKGKTVKLSSQKGTNDAIFSKGLRYYMNVWSNLQTPPVTTLCDANGKTLGTLEDNSELRSKLSGIALGERRIISFKTQDGVQLNGLMVLPADFKESRKYPVILFQYSGPGSQQVLDSWSAGNMGGMLYEQYLAQQGFISLVVDGRGTGGRGRDFEQCTYLKLGQLESHDQVETAIWLGQQPYVDKDRIGIWGWSFGGFNTLMSMSEGRPVFRCGVAVAAPSNWRYYDTVYTERFMRTPQENENYNTISPIGRADKLSGELLLIHGTADDNVHFRNCAEVSEAYVQANKQFQMQVYTNRNHFILGGNTRNHLMTRIVDFFNEKMK